jgi:hypothetical protein
MIKAMTMAACVAAMMASAGCARSEDPAKGGFFSGIANLSDGTYDKRQQERKEAVENEQDVNLQKQRELERANAQKDALEAQRTSAAARAAALESDVQALKSRLAKSKTQHADLQRQADVLQAKIDVLQNDSFSPAADKAARLEALKKEKSDLEAQIDKAIGK